MRFIYLVMKYIKMQWKVEMQYRTNLAVGLVSQVLFTAISIIFVRTFLGQGQAINGWGFWKIVFMLGIGDVTFGLSSIFAFRAFLVFNSQYLLAGDLDQLLVQPIHPLANVILRNINISQIVIVVKGILIMIIASISVPLNFTAGSLILLILAITAGTVTYCAIFIFFLSWGFWMKRRNSMAASILSFNLFNQMPLFVYPESLQFVLTFIIPISFTSFFPAKLIFSTGDGWHTVSILAGLVIAAVITSLMAGWAFTQGIKRYESVGS